VRRRNHRAAGMAVGNTKLEPGIMGQDPELRTQNSEPRGRGHPFDGEDSGEFIKMQTIKTF